MAINPRAKLKKFKKLFLKLGVPEGTIKIVIVDRPATDAGPANILPPISLGRAILNDAEDRIRLGITDIDSQLVHVWGGQLEVTGLYTVTEDVFIRARLPGGGVMIHDRLYELQSYIAGFTIGDTAMEWFLTCTGARQ